MPSYEPVDLSTACNAGVDVLGDEPGDVPLGRVDLRGLPFLIGSEPPSAERCFLLPRAPMSVGIGRLARRVIVAHRLLDPGAPAGHAVDFGRFVKVGHPRLRVQMNNVLDNSRIFASGYSYLYFTRTANGAETLTGTPYYYPLATRAVFVGLDLKF